MPEAALISSILPAAVDLKKDMWKLYATLGAIMLAALIVLIIVIRRKKKRTDATDHEANERLIQGMNEEILSEEITLTQAQFNSCVNKLVSAMSGWGTNEDKVYEVFEEMNTRSDVLQLIKSFGIKNSQNLNEWIHGDLNNSEITHINQILATKNINYQF